MLLPVTITSAWSSLNPSVSNTTPVPVTSSRVELAGNADKARIAPSPLRIRPFCADQELVAGAEGAARDHDLVTRLPGVDRRLDRQRVVGNPVGGAVRKVLRAPVNHLQAPLRIGPGDQPLLVGRGQRPGGADRREDIDRGVTEGSIGVAAAEHDGRRSTETAVEGVGARARAVSKLTSARRRPTRWRSARCHCRQGSG